jgi:hypothetical protein
MTHRKDKTNQNTKNPPVQSKRSRFPEMLKFIAHTVNAYGGILWQVAPDSDLDTDPPSGRLLMLAQWFQDKGLESSHELPLANSVTGMAILKNNTINVPDVWDNTHVDENHPFLKKSSINTFCSLPVTFLNGTRGAINLYRNEPLPFQEKEVEQAEQLALRLLTLYETDKLPGTDLIALAVFDNIIRVVSLTADGHYRFLDEEQNWHNIIYLTSSETQTLQKAVEELESLINDPNAKERDFQEFFERNSDFILNDEYKKAHSHIVLTKNDEECLIPDFMLEPVDQSSLCDLLELKLPSEPVFILKKNRMRFSAAVAEARAQLLEYNRFFNEKRNRELVYEKYGLRALMPRMFLIIGRLGTIDPLDKRKIEVTEPDLCLRTYDEVINRAKARVERMKKGIIR